MSATAIIEFDPKYAEQIIDLVINIQRNEFNIPVTIEDQPDLRNIKKYYCSSGGNFWIALENGEVLGTIGMIRFGNKMAALRKMFVAEKFRGKEFGVGQKLLNTLIGWAQKKNIKSIYLGTTPAFKAACRFYEKNNFVKVEIAELPDSFPLMKVDTIFYRRTLE